MRELHDLAATYDQALSEFERLVQDAQRQWAARQLFSYPDRQTLERTAQALMIDLETDSVEVNALSDSVQSTLVKAPEPVAEYSEVPLEDSLCVLSVGPCEPMSVSDIQGDPFLEGHATRARGLKAWASAPIMIEGVCAGTVCAMEMAGTRQWDERDQALLEQAAGMISSTVSAWAQDKKYRL